MTKEKEEVDMFFFFIPLLIGFTSNVASAFTTAYTKWWGEKTGSAITILLRDVFGIPVWALGYVLAIRNTSSFIFLSTIASTTIGWVLISLGVLIISVALLKIRIKAAAPTTHDSLVNKGIYSYVRHPIHSGTFLEFTGIFLLFPRVTVGIACLIGLGWVLVQTWAEEQDLLKRIPDYHEYMKQAPRFFPRVFTRGKNKMDT